MFILTVHTLVYTYTTRPRSLLFIFLQLATAAKSSAAEPKWMGNLERAYVNVAQTTCHTKFHAVLAEITSAPHGYIIPAALCCASLQGMLCTFAYKLSSVLVQNTF
jgi:hypothetical protein